MPGFDWSNKKKSTWDRGIGDGFVAATRARILYFAPKEFWPPDTGAKVRNYYLAREMAAYADLTYLAFSDRADIPAAETVWLRSEGYMRRLRSLYPEMATGGIERIVTVQREQSYRLSKMLIGAIGRTALTVLNYTTTEMAKCLATVLNEGDFDIVHMAGLYLSAYLPIIRAARSRPAVVCDWHNVESELMSRYSSYAPSVAQRFYARSTARRLRELERGAIGQFDVHMTVSTRDQLKLIEMGADVPVYIVENGVDAERYSDPALEAAYHVARLPRVSGSGSTRLADGSVEVGRQRIVFVGSMDYYANEDAALHFADEVWPNLRQRWPRLEFTIVGRRPSVRLKKLSSIEGIEVTGTVHDVRPYYREAIAAVVPLRVGGGSRFKILEAMAAGVPVVSSTIGADGLELTASRDILIADSTTEYINAINKVCESSAVWRALSSAGRDLVRRKYSWPALGKTCQEVHHRILEQRSKPVGPAKLDPVISNSDAGWVQPGQWVQEHGKIG